jgi:hypothetical protein
MAQEKDTTVFRDLLRGDRDLQRLYSEAFLHGLREDKSLDYAAIAKELFAVAQAHKLAGLESAAQIQELLELQAEQAQKREAKQPEKAPEGSFYQHISRVTLYNEAAVVTALEIWLPDPVNGEKIYDSGDITVWYDKSLYLGWLTAGGKMKIGDIFMMKAAVRGGTNQLSGQMCCDLSARNEAYFTLSGDLCDGPHLSLEYRPDNRAALEEDEPAGRKDPVTG